MGNELSCYYLWVDFSISLLAQRQRTWYVRKLFQRANDTLSQSELVEKEIN